MAPQLVEKSKRVCIVGAGASGLPAIRHALLYGFEVVCYEGQDEIGGLWRYKPEETNESSVMKSTVINTSKELTAYSDFPPKPEVANYMHNTQMHQYFKDYADHFDLRKHIKTFHKVENVERAADYAKTGRWKVTLTDLKAGATSSEEFDGVLMCTGHHTKPYWPEKWPGQDDFKGQIIHSHSYKDHRGYEDKVIVAVGVGNSGGDVAVELSRIAKQVYLVARRGTWVFNRVYDYGRPMDCTLNMRFFDYFRKTLPPCIINPLVTSSLNKRFDHARYGLRPAHAVFSAHPTINDELPNRIASGTVRVKPGIKRFGEHSVEFVDGTKVDNVDAVIASTGYTIEYPLIEGGKLIKTEDNEVDLYQYIFPPNLEHDTLGIIGLIQPYGSIMPVAEMQARVVLDVIAGRSKLPSQQERRQETARTHDALHNRYVKSRRHTVQVDYIPYMDEISKLIGADPPKWYELLLSDPSLALHTLYAPTAAYFYRLRGPFAWPGARQAILTIEDRIAKATGASNHGSIYSFQNSAIVASLILLLIPILFTLYVLH